MPANKFWLYALAIGLIVLLVAMADKANPKIAAWLVVALLLGVAYSQRAGLINFLTMVQQQTKGLNPNA